MWGELLTEPGSQAEPESGLLLVSPQPWAREPHFPEGPQRAGENVMPGVSFLPPCVRVTWASQLKPLCLSFLQHFPELR